MKNPLIEIILIFIPGYGIVKIIQDGLRNIELKARAENLVCFEKNLLQLKPVSKGEDHQVDN